jgi:hypothetical protein
VKAAVSATYGGGVIMEKKHFPSQFFYEFLAYFPYYEKINKNKTSLMRSPSCILFFVFPPIVARQGRRKIVPAATNTHAAIEELLGAVFSMRFMSFQILNM